MHVLFALTIQSFAGLLLLLSAGSKLRDTAEFERVLGAYEILPSPLLRPTALLLPLLELGLAAGLLLRVGDTISAWLGAGLLVVFALAIGINLARGRSEIDCGCHWGTGDGGIARWMVARNVLVALLLVLSTIGVQAQPLGAAEIWTIVSASLVFLSLYHTLPLLMGSRGAARREAEWIP